MFQSFLNQQWLPIAFVFFGILAFIAWRRQSDRRWIQNRFGKECNMLAVSFGVICYGKHSDPVVSKRIRGFLILMPGRLFFRSRSSNSEIDISARNFSRVYHDVKHKGENVHQSLVKIDYKNELNKNDCVSFKVPYPPQWISAIENALHSRNRIKNLKEEQGD